MSTALALFSALVLPGVASGLNIKSERPPIMFQDRWGQWQLLRGELDIFMHHIPDHNVVACGCGKCGSTSMWNFIYEKEFGQVWPYKGDPYVQDVTSERWNGKVIHERDEEAQAEIMNKSFSFALIRDPKERLISSWKSKVACQGELYGTDVLTREFFTQRLLQTAGQGPSAKVPCLSLQQFLEALQKVFNLERERFLDRHFLPQSYGCFFKYPPEQWSVVATVRNNTAFDQLAGRFGARGGGLPYEHASTARVEVTPEALRLLDNITAAEYEMLGDYLPQQPIAQAGVYLEESMNDADASTWRLLLPDDI
mmetsp:Transcript_68754/g.149638  ORF Transcript_68754/g.149638 Transcript_68754/m.149638 type:complete len:311 (+) Transcript_68754:104-1036(+)|eukprot:CAMPEP_0170638438 /NCGR_PEP_ID=MMETSP0224-20130122/39032_1 /TAXON_ID=285029 /ORGANISM="Togula jolla, Strain CCCM 725" /LENGTH=310 /DNA_ID=CAMNT_0010968559 /DNA_START=101 /DNA_END=1033 /DNA_ORIENTATION=+